MDHHPVRTRNISNVPVVCYYKSRSVADETGEHDCNHRKSDLSNRTARTGACLVCTFSRSVKLHATIGIAFTYRHEIISRSQDDRTRKTNYTYHIGGIHQRCPFGPRRGCKNMRSTFYGSREVLHLILVSAEQFYPIED